MTGDELAKMSKKLAPYTLHAGECLIQWIEDGSDGQRALLLFNEAEHPFRELCLTPEGRQRQKIVHAIFIETDEKGSPIDKQREHQLENADQKGDRYCASFHILKSDIAFHRYLYAIGHKEIAEFSEAERLAYAEKFLREQVLGERSSRELDHDHQLQSRFRSEFLRPFNEWKDQRGEGSK